MKNIKNKRQRVKSIQQDQVCTVRIFKRRQLKFCDDSLGLSLGAQQRRSSRVLRGFFRGGFQISAVPRTAQSKPSGWKTGRGGPLQFLGGIAKQPTLPFRVCCRTSKHTVLALMKN